MKWDDFLLKAQQTDLIEPEHFLVTGEQPATFEVQLSRWARAGKLLQVRRGLYILAPQYRLQPLNEWTISALACAPSYISLEKALEYYGLIPEAVPVYTAVTTRRPARLVSPVGVFAYRHVKPALFFGYELLPGQQSAYIAWPEKALIDLFYLNHVPATAAYMRELRLQNTEMLNFQRMDICAERAGRKTVWEAAQALRAHCEAS